MEAPVKIFACEAAAPLAGEIAQSFGTTLGKSSVLKFSDGEFQPSFDETVRGAYTFIVQSTFPPSDNLMELLLMIDAAKRASAYKIIAVVPYFGFARQDRKDKPRVSIGAKLVADLLYTAGVSRLMTMDLHADQIQGFFNIPVDHLYASTVLVPYIKNLNLKNLAIGSPDIGGAKRANAYAKFLSAPIVLGHKTRDKANSVDNITVIGEVEGKNIVIVDDMIDTAGTVCKAANTMIDLGANSVRVAVTHPILSGKAYENIEKSKIEEIIVTNSIPLKQETSKIKVLSIAELFADTIKKVITSQSISDNFII